MKVLKACAGAGAFALGLVAWADKTLAVEAGALTMEKTGGTLGVAAGAAPPPGLYFSNFTYWVEGSGVGPNQTTNVRLHAATEVGILTYAPGWKFLGADFFVFAVQPVGEIVADPVPIGPPFFGAIDNTYVFNTIYSPVNLSWNFGNGFFASIGVDVAAPTGSRYNGTPVPDYWTVAPKAAISYLGGGWNLTARAAYEFAASNSQGHTGNIASVAGPTVFNVGYHSGDVAFLDLTATKKFGKFEIGPVAYFEWQTTNDTPGGGFTCAQMLAVTGQACGVLQEAAVGLLLGYNFGPADLQVYYTQDFHAQDQFKNYTVWSRLSFRLWGPEEPPAAPPRPGIYK